MASSGSLGETPERFPWLALIAAMIVAGALRFPFLGHQSLWLDEVFTRDILGSPSLSDLWHHVQATESTPPLYYVIGWLLGGRSAVAMRAISAVALTAAVPVAYLAFRRLIGRRVALSTAWILAVSPILVSYATDARSYALLILAGLLSVWGFSAVLGRGSRGHYALWAAASVACVWTHYFGAFLVGAEIIVLLVARPESRAPTILWSSLIGACLIPLVPLVIHQSGDERAEFIAGISLTSRLSTTVRQFALGPNVPRTWLEASGLVLACAGIGVGAVLAWRSREGPRVVLALAVIAFAAPLLMGATGIDDRFYARNVIVALPLIAALAAFAMVRMRAIPLFAYLALAVLTSVWVATNWRYEQSDWRLALQRAEAVDPGAPVLAVTASSAPVVRTYLARAPAPTTGLLTRQAWIAVEPVRVAGDRGLVPASVPRLPGFTTQVSLRPQGFELLLLRAGRLTRLTAAPGSALFPGRP